MLSTFILNQYDGNIFCAEFHLINTDQMLQITSDDTTIIVGAWLAYYMRWCFFRNSNNWEKNE